MTATGFHQHASHMGYGEWLLSCLAILALVLYLVAAYLQRAQEKSWNNWRTASFTIGIVLVLSALAPAMTEFAHRDPHGHMIQHLLLGMAAPLGLVFAAPITLTLRTLTLRTLTLRTLTLRTLTLRTQASRTRSKNAARKIVFFLHSRPVCFLSHPLTALLLNIGGMYLLYLTPLYATTLENPLLHILMHVHFIIAGCLFTWAIAGPDPGPRRPSPAFRLVILFVSMAAHANLAKLLYAYGWPRGTGHGMTEIQQAAQLMYYGGDLTELILVAALFAAWFSKQTKFSPLGLNRPQGNRPLSIG